MSDYVQMSEGGGLVKSWTTYPEKCSDLSESATKAKWLKVGSLIMYLFTH